MLDQAIADIVAAAPENATIVVFSVHGMGDNGTDLLSMTILPEIMYRYNFPGKIGIGAGGPLDPPVTNPVRKSWTANIWSHRFESNPVKRKLRPWMPASPSAASRTTAGVIRCGACTTRRPPTKR